MFIEIIAEGPVQRQEGKRRRPLILNAAALAGRGICGHLQGERRRRRFEIVLGQGGRRHGDITDCEQNSRGQFADHLRPARVS
jgi:hypothetical protein